MRAVRFRRNELHETPLPNPRFEAFLQLLYRNTRFSGRRSGGHRTLPLSVDEAEREHYADLEWAQPEWLAVARSWIEKQIGTRAITGALEQVHLVPWSTVFRVPTGEGDLFFKAASMSGTFEPALTMLLAEHWPDRIAEPVAADLERGWMLTRDAGTRLREHIHSAADLHHWEAALTAYAELQIGLAPRAGELLALGVPDRRLARIPELLAELLDDRDALMLDLPEGLTAQELARMREETPRIAAMCDELAAAGIRRPSSTTTCTTGTCSCATVGTSSSTGATAASRTPSIRSS